MFLPRWFRKEPSANATTDAKPPDGSQQQLQVQSLRGLGMPTATATQTVTEVVPAPPSNTGHRRRSSSKSYANTAYTARAPVGTPQVRPHSYHQAQPQPHAQSYFPDSVVGAKEYANVPKNRNSVGAGPVNSVPTISFRNDEKGNVRFSVSGESETSVDDSFGYQTPLYEYHTVPASKTIQIPPMSTRPSQKERRPSITQRHSSTERSKERSERKRESVHFKESKGRTLKSSSPQTQPASSGIPIAALIGIPVGLVAILLMVLGLSAVAKPSTAGVRKAGIPPDWVSPLNVSLYNPRIGQMNMGGMASLMSKAGNTLYVSGMRGIHPQNNTLAPYGRSRISLAFSNLGHLARLGGSDLTSCTKLTIYVTDMYRWRPVVDQVTAELWAKTELDAKAAPGGASRGGSGAWSPPNYCPRTVVEVQRLEGDDFFVVEGTFWVGDTA